MMQKEEQAILIHSMGKVGSISVTKSLESTDLKNTRIYHTHHLIPDRLQIHIDKNKQHGKPITRHLQDSSDFSHKYLNNPEMLQNTKIITLVREPIGRNISGFFQNIDFFMPNLVGKFTSGQLKIEEIVDCFLDKYPHKIPLEWLDIEVRDIFEIDVFLKDFPRSTGYLIWHDPIDLLLVKLESLNSCFQMAAKEFMGLSDIELKMKNIGNTKKYNEAYNHFKENIILPEQYINDMYNSKYARHFYSERELLQFTERWRGNKI